MGRRYIGGSKARSSDVFNDLLPEEAINPMLLVDPNYSDKLLRQEYTRLRDIAQKRIKRMEGHPEAGETLAQVRGGFPTLKELKKEAAGDATQLRESIVYQLGRQRRFLTARRGSLSGVRSVNKQVSKELKKGGINVKEEDLANFGRFMNAMKKAYKYKGRKGGKGDRDFASDQFADMWQQLNEKGNVTEKEYKAALKEVLATLEADEDAPSIRSTRRREGTKASSFFASEKLSARTRRRGR